MLNHLHIRDFAIVDELELDFASGMTTLTGETGAGKSILLDALGLALGDRASAETVRPGAERAEIIAAFDIDGLADCEAWLTEQELDDEGECMLRRVIQASGRSRAFINGRPVPLQHLRELGEFLVDIHGQHEHQSLMRRDVQRMIVDNHAGNGELLTETARLHRSMQECEQAMEALRGGFEDQDARRDLLAYQTRELEGLDLSPEALESLDAEHRRLAHAGTLAEAGQRLLQALYEDETSAQSIIGQAVREVEGLLDKDAGLSDIHEQLAGAQAQLEEAVDGLRRHLDNLEMDPARLAEVEERISTLSDLARKHNVREQELGDVYEALRTELDDLEHSGERLAELQQQHDQLRERYQGIAEQLRAARQAAADTLSGAVTAQLGELSMAGAAFHVDVTPRSSDAPTPHGLDDIAFQVRTNAGQPFGPLNRIASGGELSRLSLAIQVAAAGTTRIPTLIFDEADSGIGGGVAEVVGRQLRALGRYHQVLCVTHLPQVASQAHHHLQVHKRTGEQTTATTVTPLARDERIQEVARMLGGMELTQATMEHATEMVSNAESA
ncbi:DNA repair protein RecN [Aquisalimonas asiatica]|uniref:DNA repair protein RecN n=1 Tax=Aquisalimonas asiatica TaxID=406100 RepID=A0A1H8QMN4_9GAMM|nr:DNA repair protein RecN [Aquisalimonas asiatica]SEO55217.1 DNA replication and repair protein RecN [Aquisalimonas asiatica]